MEDGRRSVAVLGAWEMRVWEGSEEDGWTERR
jgi:hypothetical protein